MRYIAAYLLAQIGGNATPSSDDIKSILEAAGVDIEEERLSKLISELEGKDVNELISEGSSKLASVPSGGGSASAAPAAGGAAAAAGGAAEEKKEEKKEEEKEESDDDMGFGLFD